MSENWIHPVIKHVDVSERSERMAFRQQMAGRSIRPPWEHDHTIERFGLEEPPVGTVLRWTRSVGDRVLTYLALRAGNGSWYVTGQERGAQSWEQVARWIGDAPCHVAVGWREIPRPEPEPAGDEAVKDWAAQFLPVSDSAPATEERA